MKKISFVLPLLFFISLIIHGQDRDLTKLYKQYKNTQGFEYEKADSDMEFDIDWDFGNFLGNIEGVYILSFDKGKGHAHDLTNFTVKFNKLLDKKNFKTMMDIEGDGKVQILRRKDKNEKTTDVIIVTEGDDDAAFIWASAD
jgi:hypothetical protein